MTTASDKTEINENVCPLCGKDNHCLNVRRRNAKDSGSNNKDHVNNNCWCNSKTITFPAGLTDQVPEHLKCKACICQSCTTSYNNANNNT